MKKPEIHFPGQNPGPPNPAKTLPPEVLIDHQILRRIGRGSYGEVWLARAVTGAYRAIKIVRRESFEHDRPFEREFNGILRFEPLSRKHDGQMDILHVGHGDGFFYYVMELADDQSSAHEIDPDTYAPRTLKSDLFQRERLPFEECIRVSLALTTALDYLHKNGLAHRDIKPSNVIFVNGVPKLADIGLVTGIDATRSLVGTEGFAPPEGPGTAQADIYSLGKVLYEMATGKDRQDFPELPTNLGPLPESEGLVELNAVIIKACRQNPTERYKSAEEMHRDLLLLQGGKSLAKLRVVERRLQSLKRWSVAVLIFAILVSGGFFYEARRNRTVRRLVEEKERMWDEKTKLAYATDINLAHVALKENNLGRAVEILDRQRPRPGERDLRGWEWRYLWGQCRSDSFLTLPQDASWVKMVTISPDGNLLAGVEFEGRLTVWDFKTRLPIATFETLEPFCVFSPVGSILAFVSPNPKKTGGSNEVTLWNGESRRVVATLPHDGQVGGIAFAAGGKLLVTTMMIKDRNEGALCVWRMADQKIIKTVRISGRISRRMGNNLVVARDGSFAVYGNLESISVIDLAAGVARWSAVAAEESLQAMALSSDDKILATGASWAESDIRLWDVSTGKETSRLEGHTGFVSALLFRNSDNELLSASGDQTIRLWNIASRAPKRVLRGHRSEVWSIAAAPDQATLASGGKDGAICLWDLSQENIARSDVRLPGAQKDWWFAADGKQIITVGTNRAVYRWDGPNFSESKLLGVLDSHVRHALLPSDGRNLITGDTNGMVRIHELNSLNVLNEFSAGTGEVRPVAFTEQGKLLWVLDSAGMVARPFDGVTWKAMRGLPAVDMKGASAIDFSQDGRWFMYVTKGGHCRRTNLKTGVVEEQDLKIAYVSDTTFSPDGESFAVASTLGIVQLLQTATFQEVFTMRSFLLGVTSVMFSPDGSSILAGNPGGGYALKICHLPSRQEVLSLAGEGSDFILTRFSDDGRFMGTLNSKGKLHLWRAPNWEEINKGP